MCSRFRMIADWSDVPRFLDAGPGVNAAFNPNVAPTELAPVILAQSDAGPRVVLGRFGIAMAGRDGKARAPLLNARTDGLRRGQFKALLRGQRCIVPAAGFYEWREEEGK